MVNDNAPQRQSQIAEALQGLNNGTEELDSRIKSLYDRLKPLVRQEPVNAVENTKVAPVKVPLAEEVGKQAEKVWASVASLERLLNLLEI